MNQPANNATYCNTFEIIPTQKTVAESATFLNALPYNKLFVDQLPYGKWVLVGPGATQALALTSQIYDKIMHHQLSPQAACDQMNQQMQQILDQRYS
jgi:ABC-type glycerol-3-phosphate transport system substrate-binding protein